jgi:hypothetical protein
MVVRTEWPNKHPERRQTSYDAAVTRLEHDGNNEVRR